MPARPLRASRRLLLGALLLSTIVPVTARAADSSVSTTSVVDGPVIATIFDSAGRAYVGGAFQYVGPRLGSGIALTASSVTPAAGVPDINGSVLAAVPDGAGGQFIGGSFTSVGGVARNRLAHLRADHSLDPDWNPNADGVVRALAASTSGGSIFVGGDFTNVGGLPRQRLAEVAATGPGAVDGTWTPGANGRVRVLVASATAVYAGGDFGSGGDAGLPRLVKLSPFGAGAADPGWAPAPNSGAVSGLALSDADLYVAGTFAAIGGQNRAGLAKIDSAGTGAAAAAWNPDPGAGMTTTVLLSGTDLFVGFPSSQSIGGQSRSGVAKLSTVGAGAADASWNPDSEGGSVDALALSGSDLIAGGLFQKLGGQFRNNLARLSTTGAGAADASWDPNPNGHVRALATSGSSIFAGGDFSSAGPLNESRGGLIRLNADGSVDKSWSPNVQGAVFAMALDGTDLFLGGQFVKVGGVTRFNAAKVTTTGAGAVDGSWNPGPVGIVNALAVDGGSIFVGGAFTGAGSIGGATRDRIAKLATAGTGTVDPTWNPGAALGDVNALAISGGDLIVGGAFLVLDGQNRNRLGKVSTTGTGTVDPNWLPEPSNTVNTLLVSGSSVFVGGAFTGTIGGQARARIAKLSTTGSGDADAPWAPVPNNPVFALALSGDNLYFAGTFSTVDGQARNRVARVSAASGALDAGFSPLASTGIDAMLAVAATPSRVLVGGSFASIGPLSTSNYALFDLTAPTLSLLVPTEGARYRQGNAINASYTCADPDGAADSVSCTGTAASGAPIDTATAGAKSFTVTAADTGGNSTSSTVAYTVDGSAPEISIAIPADGSSLVVGTRVNVAFTCSDPDGLGDVASCDGSAPNGSELDTSSAGTRSFTVTSADAVGNTSTKTVSYRVVGVPPVLSAFKIAPKAFKAKKGARVSFKLTKANPVTFKVTRKKGKKTVTVGSFKRAAKTGKNSFKFRAKVKGKRLKPGAYRMSARARAPSGLVSKTVSKPFRIRKP